LGLPSVTIMIPTYNQARSVGAAVASALAQDYPDLEVLVLDDASSEDTAGSLAPHAADPRLRLSVSPTNLGRLGNYRRGLDEATGAWVMMLDGDDRLVDPGFVSAAMSARAGAGREDVVAVQAGYRRIGDDGVVVKLPLGPSCDDERVVLDGEQYFRHIMRTDSFCHMGTVYDRAAARSLQFYSYEQTSADLESVARLALTGRVVLLNRVAGEWNQHGGNASYAGPPAEILASTKVFRDLVGQAAATGRLDPRHYARGINAYEARLIGHYFRYLLAHRALGPAVSLLARAVAANPAILAHRRLYVPSARALRVRSQAG
jgi:glycosyltransferase involved in cell wall biosynthesis